MSMGPIMRFKTDHGLAIELAPFTRTDALDFVEGFSKESITQYLNAGHAQTAETEQEWYDKVIKDDSRLVWGIWVTVDGVRKLIGNTALVGISQKHIYQATSASIIVDKLFWGKGIASAAHKARTYYAFKRMGLHRVKSAVVVGNVASKRALEKTGYIYVYTERNELFTNGGLRHMGWFECLNPEDWAWRQWWGNDRPTRKAIEARAQTLEALQWAEQNVELL